VRSKDEERDTLPVSRDEKWAMQDPRRAEHWTETAAGIERIQRALTEHGLRSKE